MTYPQSKKSELLHSVPDSLFSNIETFWWAIAKPAFVKGTTNGGQKKTKVEGKMRREGEEEDEGGRKEEEGGRRKARG